MLKFLFNLFLIVLLPVLSIASDFKIEEYITFVKVNSDNTAEVFETLKVHFYVPRHGIYRTIPFRKGSGIYSVKVFQNGEKGNIHRLERGDNYLTIVIGYPDRYVKGDVTYQIWYKVFKPLDLSNNPVEVGVNLIGTQWNAEIKGGIFKVELPGVPEQIKLFCGREGSRRCDRVDLDVKGNTIEGYLKQKLNPREGVSLFAYLPSYLFHSPSILEHLKFYVFWFPYVPLLLIFILVLFGIWYMFGRDRKGPIVVRFKPPEDIPPQEAGVIYDNTLDGRDIVAMILNWARRGFIKIEEEKDQFLIFDKTDYVLTKLKDPDKSFKPYERQLFYAILFKPSVRLSELRKKTSLYKTVQDVRKKLLEEVDSYAYSGKSLIIGNTIAKVAKIAMIFVALFSLPFLIPAFVGLIASGDDFIYALFSFGNVVMFLSVLIFVLSLYVFGKAIINRSNRGDVIYNKLVGFKEFFERVEKPMLERLLKEDPDYFSKYIPYAAALNILDIWVEKFSGLLSQPPQWYRGDIHRIDTGFSKSFSGTFAPSSSGSSFASGSVGGVGGGSIGGGGGGSW